MSRTHVTAAAALLALLATAALAASTTAKRVAPVHTQFTNDKGDWVASVRRYHYDTHQQLEDHLAAFLDACNFARRLKTLRGLTPYEAICKAWADEPERFRLDPVHLTSGLNT